MEQYKVWMSDVLEQYYLIPTDSEKEEAELPKDAVCILRFVAPSKADAEAYCHKFLSRDSKSSK